MRSVHYQSPLSPPRACLWCQKLFVPLQGGSYCNVFCVDAAYVARRKTKQEEAREERLLAIGREVSWSLIDRKFPGVWTQLERVP